ncbi:hypothetical protein ABPG75_009183 [Micractinium tetrahymenae]
MQTIALSAAGGFVLTYLVGAVTISRRLAALEKAKESTQRSLASLEGKLPSLEAGQKELAAELRSILSPLVSEAARVREAQQQQSLALQQLLDAALPQGGTGATSTYRASPQPQKDGAKAEH